MIIPALQSLCLVSVSFAIIAVFYEQKKDRGRKVVFFRFFYLCSPAGFGIRPKTSYKINFSNNTREINVFFKVKYK